MQNVGEAIRRACRRMAQQWGLPGGVIVTGILVRWWWAATIPLGNDEVYYWDWARDLQQSYLDHPPGVAWLGLLPRQWDVAGALGARLLIPLLHTLASVLLLLTARALAGGTLSRMQMMTGLLLTQLTPALNLGGFFLLPDAGLLVGLAAAAWIGVRVITRRRTLRLGEGLLYGLAWGVAGDFKYMALPLFAGGTAALLIARGNQIRRDGLFWCGTLLAGGMAVAPVLLWNASHDWASVRFQLHHGFGDSQLSLLTAGRFALGVVLMMSPWVVARVASAFVGTMGWPRSIVGLRDSRAGRRMGGLFLCWASAPLAALLCWQSLWKQLLPHWLVPALWMLLPLVIVESESGRRIWRRWLVGYSLVFVAAACFMASTAGRQALLRGFNERPGPLAELTLWDPLVDAVRERTGAVEIVMVPRSALDCAGNRVVLAAPRWYWVAHLSFAWPGQPEVVSIDMDAPSYYHQRNDLRQLDGCRVLVIGDDRHLGAWGAETGSLYDLIDVESREQVVVPGHRDVPVSLVMGRLRASRAVERWPLVKGI